MTDRGTKLGIAPYTWADRNPLFQTYSDHSLRLIAQGGSRRDRKFALAELAYRAEKEKR